MLPDVFSAGSFPTGKVNLLASSGRGKRCRKVSGVQGRSVSDNCRLQLFTSLPFEKLDRLKLAAATQEIGSQKQTA